jgi:hypothetical protein
VPRTQQRLDPIRWRAPRRATVIRAGAVTALLCLAVGVLYSAPSPAIVDCPVQASPSVPAAGPTSDSAIPVGLLGVTVPVADPSVLAVVRPGDRVDLHPADDSGAIIADILVLVSVPTADLGPPALFLAMTPDQASSVLQSPVSAVFRVIVRSSGR